MRQAILKKFFIVCVQTRYSFFYIRQEASGGVFLITFLLKIFLRKKSHSWHSKKKINYSHFCHQKKKFKNWKSSRKKKVENLSARTHLSLLCIFYIRSSSRDHNYCTIGWQLGAVLHRHSQTRSVMSEYNLLFTDLLPFVVYLFYSFFRDFPISLWNNKKRQKSTRTIHMIQYSWRIGAGNITKTMKIDIYANIFMP